MEVKKEGRVSSSKKVKNSEAVGSVTSRCNGSTGGVTEVVLEREKGKMRRQQMGWKEVTLTLTAPGRLVHSESHPITSTPPKSLSPKQTTVRVKRPVSLPARLKEVAQQVRNLGNKTSSISGADNIHSSSTSLESTYKDFDSDSGEYESVPSLDQRSRGRKATMSSESMLSKRSKISSKSATHSHGPHSGKKKKDIMMSVEDRIDNWTEAFKEALRHDKVGEEKNALEEYSK